MKDEMMHFSPKYYMISVLDVLMYTLMYWRSPRRYYLVWWCRKMQLSTLICRSRNRFASASRNVTPGWTEICSHKYQRVSSQNK